VAELDYHRKHGNIITKLKLGNLNATRDWSHAKDVVSAFLLMLGSTSQKDYVIASGRAYTIRELCRKAFSLIGINNWEDFVEVDPRFYRPCEVPYLRGDPSLIKKELGWKPTYNFDSLIEEMFACDKEEFNG
jgi:GDPmannose 4,6-dehydratase